MASIVGLGAWAAALGPRTAWEVDKIGQVVDVGTPDLVEDTIPVEESHMALVGSHEAGNLAGLQGQNADWVGEGSIGESTVAVETSVDLADEVAVAETAAAAVAVAVDLGDLAGEVEREVAALLGSEVAALTKECRSGERSASKIWSARWKIIVLVKSKEYISCISEGRQRKFPQGFALSVESFVIYIRNTSSPSKQTCKADGVHPAYNSTG